MEESIEIFSGVDVKRQSSCWYDEFTIRKITLFTDRNKLFDSFKYNQDSNQGSYELENRDVFKAVHACYIIESPRPVFAVRSTGM